MPHKPYAKRRQIGSKVFKKEEELIAIVDQSIFSLEDEELKEFPDQIK
jgi:hypothetical protein